MSEEKKFTCPVCEWPNLKENPKLLTYEICDQCGVEFGNDEPADYPDIRERWIAAGRPFWLASPEWRKESGS